jgi:glyoxylase-like metal-dependent hydrolase (beta-lactamase superfamily II)
MIEWSEVAKDHDGLRIYRIDAEAGGIPGSGSGESRVPNPLELILSRFDTPTVRWLRNDFTGTSPAVGVSSFSVACHVVSLPDCLVVVDSTYRTTAGQIFPGLLEEIANHEGRRLGDRPIQVIYTHAHFDHAGGHVAVEALGDAVEILAHPATATLAPLVSRRESFLKSRAHFLRDCGINADLDQLTDGIRDHFLKLATTAGVDLDSSPWGSVEDGPLRIDRNVAPGLGQVETADGRLEIFEFGGHIPGHLCVRIDRKHFVTGDMWLPGTTSLVTPGTVAQAAGLPASECGVMRYLESSQRLLDLDVSRDIAYPSHEIIYTNPKRMAVRDIELLTERIPLIEAVLGQHDEVPMRVVDLAWGGRELLSIWKVEGSILRLVIAHDEAAAWVQDLVEFGDLKEVEPEQYIATGGRGLFAWIEGALEHVRAAHGHLEFRSRGVANPKTNNPPTKENRA